MPNPIRILLADDHRMVRKATAFWLAQEQDFRVVGEVESADEAIEFCLKNAPDVVLMDVEMPGRLSFDAARTIRARCDDTRIIFVTAFIHDRYIEEGLNVGMSGYITKQEDPELIVRAIRAVHGGQKFFSPRIEERLVARGGRTGDPEHRSRLSLLSPREIEVLRYIARGLSKKEIASTMHISVKTVDNHSTSLMSKLDLHDRVELARFAIREGLARA